MIIPEYAALARDSCTMNTMPHPVSHASLRVLEFESLRQLLRGYTQSPFGQRLIAELGPSTDRDWIENQQIMASEIREFRRVGGRFDFAGLLEITSHLQKSKVSGAVLE